MYDNASSTPETAEDSVAERAQGALHGLCLAIGFFQVAGFAWQSAQSMRICDRLYYVHLLVQLLKWAKVGRSACITTNALRVLFLLPIEGIPHATLEQHHATASLQRFLRVADWLGSADRSDQGKYFQDFVGKQSQ